jgi:hypothetical protein
MKRDPRFVLITVLVLGWLLDFLFWKQAPGVNFAIYAALCMLAGFLLLRADGIRAAPRALWLVIPFLFFAVISFLRVEPLTSSLAVLATLFFMALLAITFSGGRWLEYGLADYAARFLRLAGSMIARPFAYQAELAREQRGGNRPPSSLGVWPVVRGILISLPVLLVLGALLASADLVFNSQLNDLARFLRLQDLPQYIFRLVYILLAAYTLAGVFLHAASASGDERLSTTDLPDSVRVLGIVESSIVLGSVVVLFSAFVTVQFRYFFGGAENISLQGYSFSEYARRGYGELMAVAVLSLLLLLGLGALTRRDSIPQQRLFSGMSVLIVVLMGVMLVSAYMRLGLYEMAYGFTRLRTYVHVSLIWLGLLLAGVVVLEVLRRERLFALAALAAALGFTVTLSLLNVDAFIVRQNVDRALRGQGLDVPHLASLSSDSMPLLVSYFQAPSTPLETREALGAALACHLKLPQQRAPSDWRSFTLSRWLADAALKSAQGELNQYHLLTPSGVLYNCYRGGD